MKKIISIFGTLCLSILLTSFINVSPSKADLNAFPELNGEESSFSISRRANGANYSRRTFRASPTNYFGKRTVSFKSKYRKGSIVIKTDKKKLYYILGGGKAIEYGIGVGRDGFRWYGVKSVSRKAEWPAWSPPPAMRKRIPGLPARVEGGIRNPLGARALYLGSSIYRIHGTNAPSTIGRAMSSGCIRLLNSEVKDLYKRVRIGARVYVQH